MVWESKAFGVGGNIRNGLLVGLKSLLANSTKAQGKKQYFVQIALRGDKEQQTLTGSTFSIKKHFFYFSIFSSNLLNQILPSGSLLLNTSFHLWQHEDAGTSVAAELSSLQSHFLCLSCKQQKHVALNIQGWNALFSRMCFSLQAQIDFHLWLNPNAKQKICNHLHLFPLYACSQQTLKCKCFNIQTYTLLF